MSFLYKLPSGRIRLLKTVDVEKNLRPIASRRSCCDAYGSIWCLHKNLPDSFLFFYSETPVSSRRHISELMVPGFGRPMQLLRGEVYRS